MGRDSTALNRLPSRKTLFPINADLAKINFPKGQGTNLSALMPKASTGTKNLCR
jgi:hypothetical protein